MELADTSAWTNRHRDDSTRVEFDRRVIRREIATCPPVLMELLWSARGSAEFEDTVSRMSALPQLEADRPVWDRAVAVWRELEHQRQHPVGHSGGVFQLAEAAGCLFVERLVDDGFAGKFIECRLLPGCAEDPRRALDDVGVQRTSADFVGYSPHHRC